MKTSKFERSDHPPPIRLTDRDIALITAIQSYGGFLTIRHIRKLFFANRSSRTMERRLSTLFHNHYLERPTLEQRRTRPIPEAIYWLGWRGILLIASLDGIELEEPASETANQMKHLEKSVRSKGIHWLREPHWVQLRHDIRVIDVRLAFEECLDPMPDLSLANWINEHSFRADPDKVKAENGRGKRGVIPDLYLMLVDESRKNSGDPQHKAHLLFEVDMGTRDNPRFEREKLQAYARYLGSPVFKDRFGSEKGIWLVISTGKKRMNNLIRQADKVAEEKKDYFFFSTFQKVQHANPLIEPIWRKIGNSKETALLPSKNHTTTDKKVVYQAES